MKWSLKKYITNNIPLILIYLIIVVFIIYQIMDGSDLLNEQFTNKKEFQIYSFILNKKSIDEKLHDRANTNIELSHTPYIACYIPTKNDNISKGNLIITDSLKSKTSWTHVNNGVIPTKNDINEIIVDLSYTKDGRLSCIAMGKFNKNNPKPEDNECLNNTIFHYYEKDTQEIESDWIKKDESNHHNCKYFMRSIVYDYTNLKLLGINSNDGQIYEKILTSQFSYTDWNGPINLDIPMKKVMFDKDGFLIGIGLLDNFIYRKTHRSWYNSSWNKKNINKFKVYDLIYDKDGCLISSTSNGFYKQKYSEFSSEFEKYSDNVNNSTIDLSLTNILKYRTGHDFLELLFNMNKNDEKILQQLYEYKKLTTYLCKNRKNKFIKKNESSKDYLSNINKNNDTINNLYKMISQINDSLNK